MSRFAHFRNGEVLDAISDPSINAYKARFTAEVISWWTGSIEQVPLGVQNGARYSGATTPGSPDFLDASNYVNPDKTDGNGNPIP